MNSKSAASSGGTSNSIATASSVTASTAATRSGWRVARRCRAGASGGAAITASVLLEVGKWLGARYAAPQRLALRRREVRDLTRVRGATHGARDRDLEQLYARFARTRRRDAVLAELAPARLRHPIGRPRG